MFSIITNIYNKKTKGPTLMELFTATSIFFTAAIIRAFRSARSRGNVTLLTLHEMHVAQ